MKLIVVFSNFMKASTNTGCCCCCCRCCYCHHHCCKKFYLNLSHITSKFTTLPCLLL